MMNVVLFEGNRNARVDEVLVQCLGTTDVQVVYYNSEGWQCNMAYVGDEGVLESDDLRRTHLRLFDMEEDTNPVADLYEAEGYRWVPDEPLVLEPTNQDDENFDRYNDLTKGVSIVGWVVGGSWYDEDEDVPPVDKDVYEA